MADESTDTELYEPPGGIPPGIEDEGEQPRAPYGVPGDDYQPPERTRRVWVPGHWETVRTISGVGERRRWVPGHWEERDAPGRGRDKEGRYKFYREGDEWKPLSRGLPPKKVEEMQRMMIAAGLLDRGDVSKFGTWDGATAAAYTFVLEFANQQGMTARVALQWLKDNPSKNAKKRLQGSQEPALMLEQSNPDDVAAAADAAAMKLLGRRFSDAERERFVASYLAQEEQAQRDWFAANKRAAGAKGKPQESLATMAPSMDVAAETFAKQTDPEGVAAQGYGEIYQQFLGLIGVNYAG